MKFRLPFLAFALGSGLALTAPTAAQAQVSVGVDIGLPPWGPAVPQGTQYYYIPEIDGYYDIYNGVYIVFDGQQWIQVPYLDGYDPYYFHPMPVSYVGAQPWLYINTYRQRYPQYVTVYRGGGYGHNTNYQFWQQSNHPVELPSTDLRQQRLAYLHRNPVVAGFADTPEDFLYSSARNYAGRPGLLEVLLID